MNEDYQKLIERAIEIVRDVEEPYRNSAFNSILAELIRIERTSRIVSSEPRKFEERTEEDPVGLFMERAIDASAYSNLFSAKGRLVEKSLAVLLLARDELGLDGLTAAQINEILSKKYRVSKVYTGNINRDLSKKTGFATKIRTQKGWKFLLMTGGEDHLRQALDKLG